MGQIIDGISYPTRCRIIDPKGEPIGPDLVAVTPNASKPHIGKEGIAELLADYKVRITLDDGTVLYGYECWWEPIDNKGHPSILIYLD